jgi:hypothetical protein
MTAILNSLDGSDGELPPVDVPVVVAVRVASVVDPVNVENLF